jgi:hypothetical protein
MQTSKEAERRLPEHIKALPKDHPAYQEALKWEIARLMSEMAVGGIAGLRGKRRAWE